VEFGKLQDLSCFSYQKFPNPNFLHSILHFKLNPLTSFLCSFISLPITELIVSNHTRKIKAVTRVHLPTRAS